MALATTVVFLVLFAGLQAFPQPPQPSCGRACAWCERAVQPVLQQIFQRCPLCSCAARNTSCPTPKSPGRFCLQGVAKDPRGCGSDRCKVAPRLQTISSMLRDCPKSCPGGFQRNSTTGAPLCDCVCPLERLPPMERTQRCAQTCHDFTFTTLFNPQSGCTECFCGKKLPVPNCLPFACPLHCPLGYELGPNSCPECRCKEPKNCPPAPKCEKTCLVGPQRNPFTGCITSCDCADVEEFQCTQVACNRNCGPHKYEPVLKKNCQVACKCNCKDLACPEDKGRFCVEPELDQYGCPTCKCKQYETEPNHFCQPPGVQGPVSCDLRCPSGLRPFDPVANCELCDCCPDPYTTCPNLQCETFARNRLGCPICACANQPTEELSPLANLDSKQDKEQLQLLPITERKPTIESIENENVQTSKKIPYHPMKPEVPPQLFENEPTSDLTSDISQKLQTDLEHLELQTETKSLQQRPSELEQLPKSKPAVETLPSVLDQPPKSEPAVERLPSELDQPPKSEPAVERLPSELDQPPKSEPTVERLPSELDQPPKSEPSVERLPSVLDQPPKSEPAVERLPSVLDQPPKSEPAVESLPSVLDQPPKPEPEQHSSLLESLLEGENQNSKK